MRKQLTLKVLASAVVTGLGGGALMFMLPAAEAATNPRPAAGCSRIAVSEDGNALDRDDWGASALSLGLLAQKGQQSRLVHWDYNANLARTNKAWEAEMTTSVLGTAHRFGYSAAVFYNDHQNVAGSINSLRRAINDSSSRNRLCIMGAGPMGIIYRAFGGTNPSTHPYVTIISHSDWNNTYKAGANKFNLADIRRTYAGVQYTRLPDQNARLGRPGGLGKWAPLPNISSGLTYVYSRIAASNTKGDVSDAGIMYYIITKNRTATATDVLQYLNTNPNQLG